MKKLIHIDHEPYTKWRKKLFLHDSLRESGVDLEVWCLAKYFYGDVQTVDSLDIPYLTNVKNIKEFKSLLKKTDIANTVFVLECRCNYNWRACKIFRILSNYDCFFVRYYLYANSFLIKLDKDKRKRMSLSSMIMSNKKWLYKLYCTLYVIVHGVRYFDRVFTSSSVAYDKTDSINHPDYEDFMCERGRNPIIKGNYIVFLDQYFPYHPDLKCLYEVKTLPDGKLYQNTMCAFFDYLEETYSMPVVIAAHPKANYNGEEFGGRRIIKYHTSNLVYNSCSVICHFSNSVSYLTLQEKPMAFVTTNGIESIPLMKYRCKSVASILKKQVYNIDNVPFEKISISPIARSYRDSYKYTFLTSKETENIHNIDILLNLLKEDD